MRKQRTSGWRCDTRVSLVQHNALLSALLVCVCIRISRFAACGRATGDDVGWIGVYNQCICSNIYCRFVMCATTMYIRISTLCANAYYLIK